MSHSIAQPQPLSLPSQRPVLTLAAIVNGESLYERFSRHTAPGKTQQERGDTVPGPCLLWTGRPDRGGYGRLYARLRNGPDHSLLARHRVAVLLADGVLPMRLSVLHRCHTPLCVARAHLYLGTQQQNMADMVAAGRQRAPHGTAHPRAILTESLVRTIKRRLRDGQSANALAHAYGVHKTTIDRIRHGRTWRRVLLSARPEGGVVMINRDTPPPPPPPPPAAASLRVAIPCAHAGCRHQAAYVTFGAGQVTVEVVSSHHGEKHRTQVTLDGAGRLVTGAGAQDT